MSSQIKELIGIQKPSSIVFSNVGDNVVRIDISQPEKNMQVDAAAFEGWAVILKSRNENLNVEMAFKIPKFFSPLISLKVNKKPGMGHFMRFLYRVWKFAKQMEWFSIAKGDCEELINKFEELFRQEKMINNVPLCRPRISKEPERKKEHILENMFVNDCKAIEEIQFLTDSSGIRLPEKLYNQLPNGLFVESVAKANRIFPTGFFDLWGITKGNELCIFELKNEANLKLGIISELYFYANFANDIFLTERFNKRESPFRGYDKLRVAVEKGVKKIHACFLAPSFHPEITNRMPEIQKILNTGSADIFFHFSKFMLDKKKISDFQDKNTNKKVVCL